MSNSQGKDKSYSSMFDYRTKCLKIISFETSRSVISLISFPVIGETDDIRESSGSVCPWTEGVGEGIRVEIPGREKGKEKPKEVGTEDEGAEEEEKS